MFDRRLWAEPLMHFLFTLAPTGPGKRGKTYASEGRVLDIRPSDEGPGRMWALVEGSEDEPYEIFLGVEDDQLDSDCSCPYGIDCKHGYATALVLLGEAYRRGEDWARNGAELLPGTWRQGQCHALDTLRRPLNYLFGDSDSSSEAPKPGDETGAQPPEGWWREYLNASDPIQRHQILRRAVKPHVPATYGVWAIDDFLRRFDGSQSPMDALRQYAKALPNLPYRRPRSASPSDPGLEAFLASAEAEEWERNYFRKHSEKTLMEWLAQENRASGADRATVEPVWAIAPSKFMHELPALGFQLLLTTKKLRRDPRNAQGIEQLFREVEGDRRRVSPAESRFLRWLVRSGGLQMLYAHQVASEFPNLFAVCNGVEWIANWGSLEMLHWEDGSPVVFEAEPARLSLDDREGRTEWAVRFPGPEGKTKPLTEVRVCADRGSRSSTSWHTSRDTQNIYVREGSILRILDTGDMPEHVLASALQFPEIPVDRLRGTPEGARLVQRLELPSIGEGETGWVKEVPVRPIVECRLEGASLVRIAVRAESADGTQFAWTPTGAWEYRGRRESAASELENLSEDTPEAAPAAEASATALAILPRSQDVNPVAAWMARTVVHAKVVRAPEGGETLEWRIKGEAYYTLLDLWASRPSDVTYLGDRAFRSLVTPGNAPTVRVQTEPSGTEWLKVSVAMENEIASLSLEEIAAALQASQNELVYLSGGRLYRREDLETYQRQVETLEEMGIELQGGEQRIHALQLAGARSEALAELEEGDERLRALAQRARSLVESFKGVPAASIPKATAKFLRPYQRTGADMLVWAAQTFGGAVLADDMGLGKTLQVLAALSALKAKEKKHKPALVVCPASVARNWQREAERFTPGLRTVVIERGMNRKAVLDQLDRYDLVIKNYALTRREADTLREQEWLAVCVDEAQSIKNPGAEITRTVKSIPAQYRFALTGTPIENRLTDLWSIVDFALPGYLHTLKSFEHRLRDKEAQAFQRVVRARLRPVLLRRRKDEVAPELPPRIEERRDCEMPASQRKAYLMEVQKTRLLLDGLEPNGRKAAQGRIKMLAALTRLRQICCDPALVGLTDKGSGKVDQLLELVPPILEEGHKVLLFSQFVRMLKRLEKVLHAHKIPTRMLTGETNNRQDLVDAFEADPEPSVFLISLKAGGVGLNLPSASHVILFDPWWNPAVEAQAIDRTHRIGQDKTVIAFRLVAAGTVEERILELQERKRHLVTEMLEEEAFNRTLSKEDFAYLLSGD